MEKIYDFKNVEKKWLDRWEEWGTYAFDPLDKGEIYSVDTPPPTASGEMHIGHACSYSQQDFIVRYKRMRGYNIFYPFGIDNNGLATERLIEKIHKVRSRDMGRSDFVALCRDTLKGLEAKYLEDWKRIGISPDWSISYRTIDDHCRRISQRSFIELYNMGREYRRDSPTIWCPGCGTAIAQVELKDKQLKSHFIDIEFEVEGGKTIEITTSRPELLCATVAILFHPDDVRYQHLEGKRARVPIYGYWVPIMKEEGVDPEKGTGIVMCCTFGDQNDVEWYLAHDLDLKIAFTKVGKMADIAGDYAGMSIIEARKKISQDLEDRGLAKNRRKISHMVNVHERCETEIEFLVTRQWFIRYLDLRDDFLEAGKKLGWYPDHMLSRYENWIKGLKWDWCISRQRYFGVPFPIWYCRGCGEVILARDEQLPVDPMEKKPTIDSCPRCGCGEFLPEKDVMDTWATSALTPRIVVELLDDPALRERVFPMSLRPQAHDIIAFWLFNTLVKSQLHFGKNPWKDVLISGFVLDPEGRQMSKSKGNTIKPQEVIEDFGADVLRFWSAGTSLGKDIRFRPDDLKTGRAFLIKLWNASRFIRLQTLDHGFDPFLDELKPTDPTDLWILSTYRKTVGEYIKNMDKYEFSKAFLIAKTAFLQSFCSGYIEMVKYRIYGDDVASKEGAKDILLHVMFCFLKLFAPFLPFITEEIYHKLYHQDMPKSIHRTTIEDEPDLGDIEGGDLALEIINKIRELKKERGIPFKEPIPSITLKHPKSDKVLEYTTTIRRTLNIEKMAVESGNFEIKMDEDD